MDRIIREIVDYKIEVADKLIDKDKKIRELQETIRKQGNEIERLKRVMSYMSPPPFPGNKGV